jgi:hypothetical protein
MGFRFQRRINLGNGWGVNASGSGGSVSFRGQHGSVGTKGFSVRTGIPGLSFRKNWGKDAGGAALILIAFLAVLAAAAVALRLLAYVLPLLWECIKWLALTAYDFAIFFIKKMRR